MPHRGLHPRQHTLLISSFLFLALAAGPLRAAAGDDALGLFFDPAELVETASRAPRPLNRTAENVTIIKAAEIERLNAHSMYEVLERVAGVEIDYNNGRNLNGEADVTIQGSRTEHVLVLLDGVRLNTASGGNVNMAMVPVGIIERLEIIKGPASAAWGSSLGGVINILTKKVGTSATPSGSLLASYGEAHSGEVNGDVAGAVGRLGYYLYAGRQETNGFVADRHFEDNQVYAKAAIPLPHDLRLTATWGGSAPDEKTGGFTALDLNLDELIKDQYHYGTVNLTAPLAPQLTMNVGARYLNRDYDKTKSFLGLGTYAGAIPGDFFYGEGWDEESSGAVLSVAWTPAHHQIQLGAEINRGQVSKETTYGTWAQSPFGFDSSGLMTGWGAPAFDPVPAVYEESSGFYLNDTMTWGRWAWTPGLRYDHHSLTQDITSPSLGVTYQWRDDTLLRGVVAQGFVQPVLSYLQVSDFAYPANSELKPEEVTSYQLGLETSILPALHLKASIFLHEVTESWVDTFPWTNGDDLRRQGGELEIETLPVAGLSAVANVSLVEFIPATEGEENDSSSTANLILRYDDQRALQAEVAGHYVWWDTFQTALYAPGGEYGTVLWDLRLNRKLCTTGRLAPTVFFTAHNLFNGAQTSMSAYFLNPERWLEAGLKLRF